MSKEAAQAKLVSFVPHTFEFVKDGALKKDKRTVVFAHPSLDELADSLCAKFSKHFRRGLMNWDHFADGTPNFEFEDPENLRGKNIVMLFNFQNLENVMDQYLLASVLPRQNIRRFDIVIPFFGPATMERVEREGCLATAEPCLKLISNIEPTTVGRPTIHFYDLHAIVERFYIQKDCIVAMQTALPALMKKITFIDPILTPNDKRDYVSAIAFPDDGAYKRFAKMDFFTGVPAIICAKIRDGDIRKVIIRDIVNETPRMWSGTILIIDDLVQSGGTLSQCRNALIAHRNGSIKIAAYCTHGVFPRESWKKFAEEMDKVERFDQFYLSNSIPATCNLRDVKPFIILDLEDCLALDLQRAIQEDPSINEIESENCDSCVSYDVFVASQNRDKMKAAFNAVERFGGVHKRDLISVFGLAVDSGIPEQPLGKEETQKGALNRLNALHEQLKGSVLKEVKGKCFIVSFENGVYEESNGKFFDIPCVIVRDVESGNDSVAWGEQISLPAEFVEIVKNQKQKVTIGSLFNQEFGWPAGSWHKFLHSERWVIMAEAALAALNSL